MQRIKEKRLNNAFVQIPRNDYLWEGENDGEWIYSDPSPDEDDDNTNYQNHFLRLAA